MSEVRTFADIDIDPARFGYTPETGVTQIGLGKNSLAFEARGEIIKLTTAKTKSVEAYELAQTMESEYIEMMQHIDHYLAPTNYHVIHCEPERKRARVATIQKRIAGVSIAEYLKDPEADTTDIVDFFSKCLELHKDRGIIPDIAGVEHFFDPLKNPNVIIGKPVWDSESQFVARSWFDEDAIRPRLVDTNLSRPQRTFIGPFWSKAIAWGVKKGLEELASRSDTTDTVPVGAATKA